MSITTTAGFTADDLRRWRMCERRFWLHRHSPAAACTVAAPVPDEAEDLPEGTAPDAALRASFPAARIVPAPASAAAWTIAVQRTLDYLSEDQVPAEGWAVFGACLTGPDRTQARIDVLGCADHGLRIFKVRHATVGNEADIDAVAFWVHVAARSGLRVQSAKLLLIDTDFIYPGHHCYAGLFRQVDLGPMLGSRPVATWLNAMRSCAHGQKPPPARGAHCTQGGGCEFLSDCSAEEEAAHDGAAAPATRRNSIAALEVVGRELAAELRAEGHTDLHSVPVDRVVSARHARMIRAVQRGAPVLDAGIASVVQAWGWPRRYLRIDTLGFAVPVWNGTRPYETLPFQWVCDTQMPDGRLERRAFLADGCGDPRRAFAESLLEAAGSHADEGEDDDCGGEGPVFAYNAGFERNRLRELARLFDDLAPALDALEARLVDLFQIGRAHYYHPAMAGSWSFRSICRAIAPDLNIEWQDAALAPSAPAAFARLLRPGMQEPQRQLLRDALTACAQRQSEALRRIVERFESGIDTEHRAVKTDAPEEN